jgi:hypothetical protein
MKVSEHAFSPPPQLLYAAERALTAYWVGRGWAPVSLHIAETREILLVLGTERKISFSIVFNCVECFVV